MSADTQHGTFLWTELLTRDPETAIAFYSQVFGWTTQPFPGSEPEYTMWANDGRPFGGLERLPDDAEASPNWLPYVGVLDVDAAAVRAEEEGGRVLRQPGEIPGAGRFAVLADPSGAAFAVYRSAQPQPEEPESRVGDFSWREVSTADLDRAAAFYGELFGWTRGVTHDMGALGPYALLERDGRPYAGLYVAGTELAPAWTSYVRVADLEPALASVRDGGGREIQAPMEVPGGDSIAVCVDREGAVFALHRRAG